MEIRRFGPGHRRAEGSPGTQGLAGQVIWSDDRAHISEVAFSRRGLIALHSNPNAALFIVVSGGGWVQVGDERLPVHHGEAVVWPPGVAHGAWTDGSEMRAIIVELPEPGSTAARPPIEGVARSTDASSAAAGPAGLARGALAERSLTAEDHDASEGEPW